MKKSTANIIGLKTYKALKNLVDNSIYMQDRIWGISDQYDVFNEFCTIKMSGARQIGKSTAIAKIASEYFNNAAIFSRHHRSSERLKNIFKKYNSEHIISEKRDQIITNNSSYYFFGQPNPNNVYGLNVEAIIIDDASHMSSYDLKELSLIGERLAITRSPFFFILVG